MSDPVRQQVLWDVLARHITEHFYHPDLEALRVVLAAVHAHYSESDPVWLFVIGPPGSGKTTIAINCISALPDVIVVSDLTPRSFIAGKSGKSSHTLLNKRSIILAFKDFTTMVSKREETQREIMAILREVYDGQMSYRTSEAARKWEGKATAIAAVTPAIERAWAINRDLGERFSQIRWQNTKRPTEAAKMARAQIGHEKSIAAMMRAMTIDVFQAANNYPGELPEPMGTQIDAVSSMIAILRRHVIRDSSGGRPIIDVSAAEEPTRIAKGLGTIAGHHAALFGRDVVNHFDMRTAMRTALDTVPSSRMGIVECLPGTYPVEEGEIVKMSGLHRNTVKWQVDELEALGVLQISQDMAGNRTCAATRAFFEMWQEAGLG